MATSQTHVAPLSLEETTVSASMPSTWVCFGGWGGVGEVCAGEEKIQEEKVKEGGPKKKRHRAGSTDEKNGTAESFLGTAVPARPQHRRPAC